MNLRPTLDAGALIRHRLNQGLNQRELVARVQLRCNRFDERTLGRWESGATRHPTADMLKCVADALGIRVEALLCSPAAASGPALRETPQPTPANPPAPATSTEPRPVSPSAAPAQLLRYRIFLASPNDVPDERRAAREIIDRLAQERHIRDVLALQPVAWDHPGAAVAMQAALTPQAAIAAGLPKPADCDLFVGIFWGRIGTPLPPEYRKPDGSPYASGSEWEFCNARDACKDCGRPEVWLFRRRDKPVIEVDAPDAGERTAQWRAVEALFAGLRNDDGSLAGGVNRYATPAAFPALFEGLLRDHLHAVIARSTERAAAQTPGPSPAAATPTPPPAPTLPPAADPGHATLTIELTPTPQGLRRIFRHAGNLLRFTDPAPGWDPGRLKEIADAPLPNDPAALGAALYRLLFHDASDQDLFPTLAPGAGGKGIDTPRTRAFAVTLCWRPADQDATADPWPLRLPWHLTRHGGECLAERCGWTFTAQPPGIRPDDRITLIDPEHLLLMLDPALPDQGRHVNELTQHLDQHWRHANEHPPCPDLSALPAALARHPTPAVLYVYAPATLDLDQLAAALAGRVRLLVLNLIGARVPQPPAALVQDRLVLCAVHGLEDQARARGAGCRWLAALLADPGGRGLALQAVPAFGPRLRHWSSGAGLQSQGNVTNGGAFHARLVKLLLDRVKARAQVSDEVAQAFLRDGRVLALLAAGGPTDRPDLLMPQVWHHYQHLREAAAPEVIRPYRLETGPLAAADELLRRFATVLGADQDTWPVPLDQQADALQPGEHLILSLQWRLTPVPADAQRSAWLNAMLDLCETLAGYQRPGLLLVNCLVVETAAAPAWTADAWKIWRNRRAQHKPPAGLMHLRMEPLSVVPVEDIEYFLEHHYPLCEDLSLDPYAVAQWIIGQHQGAFADTVALVEHLHHTAFAEYPRD